MANAAHGGMITGLLSGFRQGRADARDDQDYEAAKERRRILQEREAMQFDQTQQDRSHMLERRPIIEGREDAQAARQAELGDLSIGAARFKQSRMPLEAEQDDAKHALGMRQGEEGIANLRTSRAATSQSMSHARERQGRERKQWEREDVLLAIDDTRRTIAPAFIRGAQTGDWSALQEEWNASPLGEGSPVDSIQQMQDGRVQVVVGGKPVFAGTPMEFEGFVSKAIDPTAALTEMQKRRSGQENLRAGLGSGGTGRGATDPAVIKETEQVFRRLAPIEGESDDERWMRAYEQVNERGHTPLEDQHAKIYQQALKELNENPVLTRGKTPAEIADMAYESTDRYIERRRQRQQRAPTDGAQPGATAPAPAAAQPASAATQGHGKIVRTGVDKKTGQRMVQYEDGTVAPAPTQ